jgi:hypothetical protein
MQILNLSDGSLLSESNLICNILQHSSIVPSVLTKYFALPVAEGGVPKLKIYKDAALITTLDLKALCGWTNTDKA